MDFLGEGGNSVVRFCDGLAIKRVSEKLQCIYFVWHHHPSIVWSLFGILVIWLCQTEYRQEELNLTVGLHHPNIVPLLGVALVDPSKSNKCYVIMPKMTCKTVLAHAKISVQCNWMLTGNLAESFPLMLNVQSCPQGVHWTGLPPHLFVKLKPSTT